MQLKVKLCPIEIEPESKPIRLLMLLMRNPGKIIEYKDIAKELKIVQPDEVVSNKDVARDIQFIKRDLIKIVKSAGVPEKLSDSMFMAKENIGIKYIPLKKRK